MKYSPRAEGGFRMETSGGREIEAAGLVVLSELPRRSGRRGFWYTAAVDEDVIVLFLRENAVRWHAFYKYEGTGSGHDPVSSLSGGLGDVISTDADLKIYCRLVLEGPGDTSSQRRGLVEEFRGLAAAQSQCYTEFHQI